MLILGRSWPFLHLRAIPLGLVNLVGRSPERCGTTHARILPDRAPAADRPPRTVEHAQRIAAEHFAFCDECAGKGLTHISRITDSLMESPIWTFWWD